MHDFSNLSATEIAQQFINSTNQHLFITGKAGTGKTTFLKNIVENTFKKVVVAAPTGIAAINAGGVTLHSLFQLPFGSYLPESGSLPSSPYLQLNNPQTLRQKLKIQGSKRQLIRQLELLIIDEVSMLRADLLDAIDEVLKTIRRNQQPFGGIQILFIGDLYQLPPVIKDEEWRYLNAFYHSIYFFESRALSRKNLITISLDKVFRQSDPLFLSILNGIRNNNISDKDVELLNQCYQPNQESLPDKQYIMLTTHNHKADQLNRIELEKLKTPVKRFKASVNGDFNENNYPVDATLSLKEDAQVMMIKNDISGEQRYFNGKIGVVKSMSSETIEILFDDQDETVSVEKYEWENKRFQLNQNNNEIEEKVIGKYAQFPIKLAWAITIHKSQGLTFDHAIIDVSDAFAPGQIYVALSRLTSLDGLILSAKFRPSALTIAPEIEEFTKTIAPPHSYFDTFKNASVAYVSQLALKTFDFRTVKYELDTHLFSYNKSKSRSNKQKHKPWIARIITEFQSVLQTGNKFLVELNAIVKTNEAHMLQRLSDRIVSAGKYFEPIFLKFSKDVIHHLEKVSEEPNIKTYLKELNALDLVFLQQVYDIRKTEGLIDAAISNSVFNSQSIKSNLFDAHQSAVNKLGKKKKSKTDTKTISFNLFKEGNNIEEIAEIRHLVPGTIEGHLTHFVTKGEINIDDVLPEEKITAITKVQKTVGGYSVTSIKEKLGSEFSYGEIRMVLSSLNQQES